MMLASVSYGSDEVPCLLRPNELAYALGAPDVTAEVRSRPEDFHVEEELGFLPEGEGSHAWLQIRKRNLNTACVARRLARFAQVSPRQIGFAGLKDRSSVATQWFSVDVSGKPDPDWVQFSGEDAQIVYVTRHPRKLRRGQLKGNRFRVILRGVHGGSAAIAERLAKICRRGAPNYFGEQRFGVDGANVRNAYRMLVRDRPVRDRHKRGLYLSAARALLFNHVLSRRVAANTWSTALPGDVMMLEGTHSIFEVGLPDDEIRDRLDGQDIHPTGPLWGCGALHSRGEARSLETSVLKACEVWREGLERAGLKQERRALRIKVKDLTCSDEANGMLRLGFGLPAGSYATAVLRELVLAA